MAAADPQTQQSGNQDASAPPEEMGYAKVEGPVMTMMSKRLRALRKKLNRIVQIEESKAAGKAINKEQEEMLKSKTTVTLLIDEYEKLKQPLLSAVKEEVAECERGIVMAMKRRSAEMAQEKGSSSPGGDGSAGSEEISATDVGTLVQLLYFAGLFDLRDPSEAELVRWRNERERRSCLTYDPVTDDDVAAGEGAVILTDRDLNAIAALGRLLTSRVAVHSAANHEEAVALCITHALKLLSNSSDIIDSDLGVTYAQLKERLNKIMSSRFFTEAASDCREVALAAAQGTNESGVEGQALPEAGAHPQGGDQQVHDRTAILSQDADGGDGSLATEAASQDLQRLLLDKDEQLQQNGVLGSGVYGASAVEGVVSSEHLQQGVQSLTGSQSSVVQDGVSLPFAPQGGFLLDIQQLAPESLVQQGTDVSQANADYQYHSMSGDPAQEVPGIQGDSDHAQQSLYAAQSSILSNGDANQSYLPQAQGPNFEASSHDAAAALPTQQQAFGQPAMAQVNTIPGGSAVQQKQGGGGYGRRGGRGGYRGGRGGRGGSGRHGVHQGAAPAVQGVTPHVPAAAGNIGVLNPSGVVISQAGPVVGEGRGVGQGGRSGGGRGRGGGRHRGGGRFRGGGPGRQAAGGAAAGGGVAQAHFSAVGAS